MLSIISNKTGLELYSTIILKESWNLIWDENGLKCHTKVTVLSWAPMSWGGGGLQFFGGPHQNCSNPYLDFDPFLLKFFKDNTTKIRFGLFQNKAAFRALICGQFYLLKGQGYVILSTDMRAGVLQQLHKLVPSMLMFGIFF